MKIRVYHNNDGTVKVTKQTCDSSPEITMFSDVQLGDVAEVTVGSNLYYKANKSSIERDNKGE